MMRLVFRLYRLSPTRDGYSLCNFIAEELALTTRFEFDIVVNDNSFLFFWCKMRDSSLSHDVHHGSKYLDEFLLVSKGLLLKLLDNRKHLSGDI